jgi:carbamoyltransferase
MKILSIYWGICASASLSINGRVVTATHEERFTRKKNDDAFPCQAIDDCLQRAGIKATDLDLAVVASNHQDRFHQWTRPGLWSIEDYLDEQRLFWLPKLLENQDLSYEKVMSHKGDSDQYPEEYWSKALTDSTLDYSKDRGRILAEYLGLPIEKVSNVEHHYGHAAYSYIASGWQGKKVLALTIDAHGDGSNATISTFDEKGNYKNIFSTNNCGIARIYRYMTLLLGMKPNEHEFKVMGLAPYGKPKYSQKAYGIFSSTLDVEGLNFIWKIKPTDSYAWFRDRLEGVRFDSVAWGLQHWVEALLCKWVTNAVKETGIRDIVLAGGVAMNIKAMGAIAQLDCVNQMFVGGSASDESLAISSGLCAGIPKGVNPAADAIPHLYLGPEHDQKIEEEALTQLDLSKYEINPGAPLPEKIATLLSEGKILARSAGPMEFGQRALGNRSILADPTLPHVKETINAMVKNRDFWMPFAPIILPEYTSKYLENPKNLRSPYMTIGFNTTPEGFEAMRAACHPADHSVRPQIVENNPEIKAIIEAFVKITGRGALLNTSFNLHGYPIVNTPSEAIYVLENSGLNGLILNHALVLKR